MLSYSVSLSKQCSLRASKAAGPDGFIAMKTLANHFGARIESRPLLVEATLAIDTDAKDAESPWVVLIDSERYEVSASQIELETAQRPLPPRLRTTIAHELLHILMFKSGKDGPELTPQFGKAKSTKNYVKEVEGLTERLTPLLLVPESEVDNLTIKSVVPFADFISLRQRCGVSREILINRFSFLDRQDPRSHRGGLRNKALGIIQRSNSGSWVMQPWPLFYNFDSNRLPWFISKLASKYPVEMSRIVNDTAFVLNGGTELEVKLAGHDESQKLDYMKMQVRLTVDSVIREQDEARLFLVERAYD